MKCSRFKQVYLLLGLLIVLTGSLSGCSSNAADDENGEFNDLQLKEETKIIKVLLHHGYEIDREMNNGIGAIRYAAKLYEEKTGVQVLFETMASGSLESYSNKLMSMIAKNSGPDLLVMTSQGSSLSVANLIESGTIEDISKDLEHYDQLIEGVQNGYFYPCVMLNLATTIHGNHREFLEKNESVITDVERYKVAYLNWLEEQKPYLNAVHFYQLTTCFFDEISDYITFDENFSLTDDYVVEKLIEYSRYFNDRQYFDLNKDYDYDGIRALLLDTNSKDHDMSIRMYFQSEDEHFLKMEFYNTYNLKDVAKVIEAGDIPCLLANNEFRTTGLAVNSHSLHKERATEFIDFMISEEIQGSIVEKLSQSKRNASGTVNAMVYEKELARDRILYDETLIEFKTLFYDRINSHEIQLVSKDSDLKRKLTMALSPLILAYGYGEVEDEKELVEKLNAINNEMFILINE